MGMSTHIVGLVEQTDLWRKYKQVWDACIAAGIKEPKEVYDYFDGIYPEEDSRIYNLERATYVRKYQNDMCSGFEIRVDEIPEGMKVIRFYNSW